MHIKNLIKCITISTFLIFTNSCDNEECPEGSVPIHDAMGNLVDCFDAPNFGEENATKE